MTTSNPDWDAALQRCADEQIQFIGQVQGGHALIAIHVGEDRFTHLSENASEVLGGELASLWSKKPSDLLGDVQLLQLARRAQSWGGRGARLVEAALPACSLRPAWIHQSGPYLVLEIEILPASDAGTPDAWDWEDGLRHSLRNVEGCADLPSKLEAVVEETAKLGGFDRVMIYRFLNDGVGEVVAERVRDDWEPYLGLRYPASDIPQQARELFLKNDIRLIREVVSVPIPLFVAPGGEGTQIDLSLSRFRQPSPIHIEYLRNMGVASSFVSAVITEGKLWGLISCHHGQPLEISATRQVQLSALTGQLAVDLASMARELRLRNELACARISSQLIQCITMTDDWTSVLMPMAGDLSRIFGSEGMSLHFDGKSSSDGTVPTADEADHILTIGIREGRGVPYSFVRDAANPAPWLPEEFGGFLVIPLSHFRDDALVFYRKEETRKVAWAGEPTKVVDRSDGAARLRPRASFEAWQETVRGTCEPWSEEDLAVASAVRATLSDIVITAHYFRSSFESPVTARHRLAHEADSTPVALADENGLIVFRNPAAATDPVLGKLQSLDALDAPDAKLPQEISAAIPSALNELVHGAGEFRLPLSDQDTRIMEGVRLLEGERLLGYSIRITGGR